MIRTSRKKRHYQIGHISISMVSSNMTLLEMVGNWISKFEVSSHINEQPFIRFTMIGFESNDRVPFRLPSKSVLLYKNDYTSYYELDGLWIILLQSATVIINRATNKIIAFAHYNDLKKSKYLEDFMHPLVELLRQNGIYAHHAGAVSYNGRGLLLLGKSGQGKTTLSVDLLHNGFDFLADDRCFLMSSEQGMEMLGFYEPIRYYPTNIDHIKSVHSFADTSLLPHLSNGKHQLDLIPIFQDKIIEQSKLVGLVFPYYSPSEAVSRVEIMPQNEALIIVLPLTMVCFDRQTSKSHFDFCVQLTTRLPAIKLIMGQDHENWHKLIKQYLSTIPMNETKDVLDPLDHHYN